MRGLVAALLLAVAPGAAPAVVSPPAAASVSSVSSAAGAAPATDRVAVSIAPSADHTQVGKRFRFRSTVRNDGDRPLRGLVAHLDVVSLDPGVYVDPEDWSSQRTVYLDPLPARGTVQVPWRVQVVNDGRFVLYVVVSTVSPDEGPAAVDVSDGLRLSATAPRTIGADSVLPVALGVPAALALLLVLTTARSRRRR